MNKMSFSDKLKGKTAPCESINYVCDTCSKCKNKYFINLDIDGENKYICSYLCSKNLHEKYGKNYWDNLVNVEDFNKYPIPPIYNNKYNENRFELKISPYETERLEYYNEMLEEDRRIAELENYSDTSSNSEYDYE